MGPAASAFRNRHPPTHQNHLATIGVHSRLVEFRRDGGGRREAGGGRREAGGGRREAGGGRREAGGRGRGRPEGWVGGRHSSLVTRRSSLVARRSSVGGWRLAGFRVAGADYKSALPSRCFSGWICLGSCPFFSHQHLPLPVPTMVPRQLGLFRRRPGSQIVGVSSGAGPRGLGG